MSTCLSIKRVLRRPVAPTFFQPLTLPMSTQHLDTKTTMSSSGESNPM